ncbi:hypothetical protein [Massilia sp. METH4]|uniref:hypothetical protein n=1 Tax=Massilia sp. METH4 TaxID=3123041 RepID=UPI0030D42389
MSAVLNVTSVASRQGAGRALLLLAVLLALLPALFRPQHYGDANEYILTTLAFANHGTPDLRLSDLEQAQRMLPEMAAPYALLEPGLRDPNADLYAAYVRGRGNAVYAVHFFGYPLMATVPFKLLQWTGLSPLKCYQLLNLAFVLVLGAALYRAFGTLPRMLAGVALFFVCGGALYWNWSSPECVTAAALLAGLLYFTSGAPLRGALLAGVATLQNPTTVFFFGFAPLLLCCLHYRRGAGLRAALAPALQWRVVLAIGAGLAVFALAPLFNLWAFGVPNIIAKKFTTPALIGLTRLHSFFLDLNQGMLIAVPALAAVLVAGLFTGDRAERPRRALLLGASALFVLCLAVPALSINNWNSGATGVMRYGFWCAMPLLFAFLVRLQVAWPTPQVTLLAALQALCMVHALSYHYTAFSPLQRAVFALAPGLVNPEPEIFAERAEHKDDYIDPMHVYQYAAGVEPVKTLYNAANTGVAAALCGPGGQLSPGNNTSDSYLGWRYINGAVQCKSADLNTLLLESPAGGESLRLASGWSRLERGGGNWTGAWSDGAKSRIEVALADGHRPTALTLAGQYFDGNRRTRVTVNGKELGWFDLAATPVIPLAGVPQGATLEILLDHEAPRRPDASDSRQLSFFLRKVRLS